MSMAETLSAQTRRTVGIRVRGTVQGVGFRPTVWRIARECGLTGTVRNDAAGVLIKAAGTADMLDRFISRLRRETPPLSHIDGIDVCREDPGEAWHDFTIVESEGGATCTQIAADAAICDACREEILSPFERRFRYPFTNCTHCGPRLSIIETVPYDRERTTMAPFPLCDECAAEFGDPSDRRFHAQPIACHACGPRASLERLDGKVVSFDQHSMLDDVDAVTSLLQKGEIVAIKGLGGFHLACDATNDEAVSRLRARKRRYGKPFALMARDLDVITRYCSVGKPEAALLQSSEAPIVLLDADGPERLADEVAPGVRTLGFMLPYTPLHVLILRRMDRPVVMTSGNLSDEPQIIDDGEARERLRGVADYALFHDRRIANRVDDSVVRVVGGRPRLLRRARGYAPGAIALPRGFEDAPDLLAFGGELKSTFCLVKDGAAILSQHQGDLEDARTFDDYQANLALYRQMYDHAPSLLVADRHPEYLSTKLALETAAKDALPLVQVQHHHAHIAACLAENGVPLDTPPVLGVALDGVGYGDDGTIWGGEFLLADYAGYERVGTFKPVAMPGGAQAIREPWRNTYAHLMAEMGWVRFAMNFSELELFGFLSDKPRETLDRMIEAGVNSPLASSCGRLFDAVAAAMGLAREHALYEGQGAMELEAIVCRRTMASDSEESAYPFAIPNLPRSGRPYVEPLAMWQAVLGDLILKTPKAVMAARFHKGLAKAIAQMIATLVASRQERGLTIDTVALSGGCFQNAVLAGAVARLLEAQGLRVLQHAHVPANDGGLALGQAAIAAAQSINAKSKNHAKGGTRQMGGSNVSRDTRPGR